MGESKIRRLENICCKVMGAETMLRLEARLRFHKRISISNPITLSDKICYLEFREKNDLRVQCSDKYAVRKYVEDKGLGEILVPIYGDVYTSFADIDFDELPMKFVIKARHGCQMNLICTEKTKLNMDEACQTVNKWMFDGFNRSNIEPHYSKIPKGIIVEKYLENADAIKDYKIHCLNGHPEFILVCSERTNGLRLNLYDLDWQPINKIIGKHKNTKEIIKPKCIDKMIEISKKLSEDFKFVRVDLYEIDGEVYFGEMTFTPDGGMLSYFSQDFDEEMGKRLKV